jgi:hypothetical protein
MEGGNNRETSRTHDDEKNGAVADGETRAAIAQLGRGHNFVGKRRTSTGVALVRFGLCIDNPAMGEGSGHEADSSRKMSKARDG